MKNELLTVRSDEWKKRKAKNIPIVDKKYISQPRDYDIIKDLHKQINSLKH